MVESLITKLRSESFLSLEKIPKPDDTADALALAVCHANYSGTDYSRLYKEAGR